MTRFFLWVYLLPVLLLAAPPSQAEGFGINATRLVYPEKASSISVTLRNTQPRTPYLVQVKVSSQQDKQAPAPFAITPPLFRLEPQSVNQVRIAFTGTPLPRDRESVFYFHATAIPAGNSTDTSGETGVRGVVRFGVGSVIKLFYRPTSLQGSSAAAQKELVFTRTSGGLKVTNPSAFYVNLASMNAGGQKLPLDSPTALMLAPSGTHTWSVKPALPAGSKIAWRTINDTGGIDEFSSTLP